MALELWHSSLTKEIVSSDEGEGGEREEERDVSTNR